MADKIKKISINAFEKAVEDNYEEYVVSEWRGLSVTIKKCLSLNDIMAFAEAVSQSSFSSETNTFMPEITDFAIKSAMIKLYTNISLPSNMDKRYDLIYHSDIIDFIVNNVNEEQLDNVIKSTYKKIDSMVQANVSALTKQMNDISFTIENMKEELSGLFSGITSEQINNIVSAISNGQISEDKIVKALFKDKGEE